VAERLRVDFVSDVVCPWCFIGKRRLEAASRLVPDVELEVRWHPFQLDETIPVGGIPRETYLLRKFGSEARVAQLFDRVREAGAAEGLAFAFEKIAVSPNTLDAHRMLLWAGQAGVQDALKERLFRLYFFEGGNLADRDVLADAAEAVGFDRAAVRARLETSDDMEETRAHVAAAHKLGVTGVPFFIFGGAVALPGAHEADVIADAIREAVRRGANAA